MDNSPIRRSASQRHESVSPLRKDNAKTIPKLISEQQNVLKQAMDSPCTSPTRSIAKETVASDDKATAAKNTTTSDYKANAAKNQQQPTTHTKIPMKRTPASILPTRMTNSPRASKPPLRTASKLSLTVKEIGKKLDSTSSRGLVKMPTFNSLKSPFSGLGGMGSGRSGSTISCKSFRSQRNEGSTDGSGTLLQKITSTSGDQEGCVMSARERFVENNKLKVFESLHKKLQNVQSDFMQKFENLKLTAPEKLKNNYKFITMIKNDECKLVIKEEDQLKIPKKLPASSLNDLKEKIRQTLDKSLHTLFENLNNETDSLPNFVELQCKVENAQQKHLCEIYEVIHDMCSSRESDDSDLQIVAMQKEIQEAKRTVQALERKIDDTKKDHVDEIATRERELREETDSDIMKRDVEIAELIKKQKMLEKQCEKLKTTAHQINEENNNEQLEKIRLQEDLSTCKENMQCMVKKLANADAQLSQDKKDKNDRLEAMRQLENELDVAHKKIEDLLSNSKGDCVTKMEAQEREMIKLRMQLDCVEREKRGLENQMEKMRYDILTICDLRNKLTEADDRIRELQVLLEEHNSELTDKSELPKEVLNELSKLRQSEGEKRREIEKLRVELSKLHFNICQMEEQVQRDQQLLDVRSELINSLQTNDASQRVHLDELFAQVGERNNTINEVGLSNELRTKSEEFRNLFTTLSTKQLELSRQEHMIKLLEESNERSQMLRVKQEEKIGRMEEEIAQLKHTVSIYNNNMRCTAGCKSRLFAPVSPATEYNENFYYYTSERRRKRQVDINVKKYET